MWGAVKDKCYADKPKTIDAFKEAIGEIQLHTINNVLKNWTRTDIKTKYEKYFFGDFLSADFWQKL